MKNLNIEYDNNVITITTNNPAEVAAEYNLKLIAKLSGDRKLSKLTSQQLLSLLK